MPKVKYSIIIPAYNEERRIRTTLSTYCTYLEEHYAGAYEILVVLNGCRDKTLEIVRGLSAQFPTIKIAEYAEPIGKGGAIHKGFSQARGKYIGYVDADCSTRPEEMMKLFALLKENTAFSSVIASRRLRHSQVSKKKLPRKVMSTTFNLTVNTLFDLQIADTQCGAKVFTREAIETILPHLKISNLVIDVDILTELKRRRLLIMESPTVWADAEHSTISRPVKTSLVMFVTLLKMKILKSRLRYLYKLLKPAGTWLQKRLMNTKEYAHRYISF